MVSPVSATAPIAYNPLYVARVELPRIVAKPDAVPDPTALRSHETELATIAYMQALSNVPFPLNDPTLAAAAGAAGGGYRRWMERTPASR